MLLEDGLGPVRPPANWRECFDEIVGRGPAMAKVLETVHKISRSDGSVLILGESGTGKDMIARAVHRLSTRSDQPFIALNCSAIPETLLESELFGYEKGAFTGADRARQGYFEQAHRGTLFLDEIGDMPLTLQAKLLRVLQEKKYTPLGGKGFREADVRIVAATNTDLHAAIANKSFRQDLYFRLNVLPVHIPALRERMEDVRDLLTHFIEINNSKAAAPCFFSDELVRLLCDYRWPGNVRELQHLVERLVVLKGDGAIDIDDLPRELLRQIDEDQLSAAAAAVQAPVRPERAAPLNARTAMPLPRPGLPQVELPRNFSQLPAEGIDLAQFIEDLENDLIRQALERTGNNRNQAAKLLGLNRTTLVERIKKRRIVTLNEPSKEL